MSDAEQPVEGRNPGQFIPKIDWTKSREEGAWVPQMPKRPEIPLIFTGEEPRPVEGEWVPQMPKPPEMPVIFTGEDPPPAKESWLKIDPALLDVMRQRASGRS